MYPLRFLYLFVFYAHLVPKTASHFSAICFRARFDLIVSDRRSKPFYLKHNLIDPRFTSMGLMLQTLFLLNKKTVKVFVTLLLEQSVAFLRAEMRKVDTG